MTGVNRDMRPTDARGPNKLLLPMIAFAGPMATKRNLTALKSVIEAEAE